VLHELNIGLEFRRCSREPGQSAGSQKSHSGLGRDRALKLCGLNPTQCGQLRVERGDRSVDRLTDSFNRLAKALKLSEYSGGHDDIRQLLSSPLGFLRQSGRSEIRLYLLGDMGN